MQVSDFDFDLPDHLIAKYPTPDRTASRLLHLNATTGHIAHYFFRDIIDLLAADDLLVFNNTRVIPARLYGTKSSGGAVEILFERILDEARAVVQIRASKAPKPGMTIQLDGDHTLEVVEKQDGFYLVQFAAPGPLAIAQEVGHMPLPPYIDRQDELDDKDRYQTVYAEKDGAVAAPTAGLHFDAGLMSALAAKGIDEQFVTLHVGAGTFQPVRVENVEDHQMHTEYLEVDETVCTAVQQCRQRQGRVVAVGTTSVRSLESASASGSLAPFRGDTDIFIYPGYEFRSVDAMVTNFHLPGSTLLMLISAFAGLDNVRHAYQTAIEEQYRFFSYGDAMLITR